MRTLRIILSRINKMWLLMGAAIILGIIATWVTTSYLKTREARIEAEAKKRASGGTTVEVVVPTRRLGKGAVVDGSNMASRDVLADTVYDETVLAADFGKVQGSKLLRPIEEGRPLRMSDLDILAKDFSETLPEGKRAITIEIDELNSVSGMARVGNRLDLMLIVTDNSEGGSGQQQVLSLLQKVKIIATGQTVTRAAPSQPGQPAAAAQRYSNVTFEVTPEEAARIALAQQMGRIRAVLRSDEDQVVEPLPRVNTQTVMRGGAVKKKKGGDVDGEDIVIEYIIGGKNSGGGIGQTQTINVNMPNIPGLGGAPGAAASAGPAMPSGQPQQVTVPGVGTFNAPTASAAGAKPY
jgi:pilus assembly protein CpaB